jgi:hypothetical protein
MDISTIHSSIIEWWADNMPKKSDICVLLGGCLPGPFTYTLSWNNHIKKDFDQFINHLCWPNLPKRKKTSAYRFEKGSKIEEKSQ